MGEKSGGWKWWQKAGLAGGLLLFTLVALLIGMRRPWIEPLPGVRLGPSAPSVKEVDLGPESAFRLLQAALQIPTKPPESPSGNAGGVWRLDWTDALTKLQRHSWPTEPPAPPDSPTSDNPFDRTDDPGLSPEAPWTRAQYEDILRRLHLLEPQIVLLDRALTAADARMPNPPDYAFSVDFLADVRELARWLAVSAQYRAATGDYAGSFADMERTLDLAIVVSHGWRTMGELVAIACDAIALDSARTVAVRKDIPASVLRQAARHLLACADKATPFVEVLRADSLGIPSYTRECYRSGFQAFFPLDASGGNYEHLRRWVVLPLAPLTGSTPRTTAGNLTSFYQHAVTIAERPYSARTVADYQALAPLGTSRREFVSVLLRKRDPLGYLAAAGLSRNYERAHQKTLYRDAMLRGMALFLAIKAYEQEHGAPPETLDQLVPDYLPRVPADPFGGKPFRYLRSGVPGLPTTAWAVYSIGEDFTDDGGTAHSVGTPWDGKGPNPDLVWPSQDYPPPAAAAE